MPILINTRPELGVIYVVCTGVIRLDEIMQYESDVVADPQFDPGFAELLDLDFKQVSHVVNYEKNHARYVGTRKVAFVAPKDLEFGLTRMYEMMEEDSPMDTRVFRDTKTACEWLELDPDKIGFDS